MKVVVTGLLSFFLCIFAAAQATRETSSDVARGSVSGLGFTLTLPEHVELDVTPTTDLAFGLDLSQPTRGREWERLPFRYIGFATRWNTEGGSLEDVVRRMTSNLAALVPTELVSDGVIQLASTFPAKLGELPARRLVVTFKNRQKKAAIMQVVVGYRARPDASSLVYVATLTTTREDFPQDVDLFAKLLAGFKLTPIE